MAGGSGTGTRGVKSGFGRLIVGPLMLLDLILAIIVLGMAGYLMNRAISFGSFGLSSRGGFGGNAATPWLSVFSLVAGMTTIASIIAALHHLRVWTGDSGAAAQATSWIAWLLLVLAFCLAWKEVHIGGRSRKHKVLEAFVIILTFTKFFSTLALYIEEKAEETAETTGPSKFEPQAISSGTGPGAPAAASAV